LNREGREERQAGRGLCRFTRLVNCISRDQQSKVLFLFVLFLFVLFVVNCSSLAGKGTEIDR
jgi:hypothetical protein